MTKIKQSLLSIVIGLALAAGISYAWTGPVSAPPAGNTDAPINVGSLTQYKSGALGIGGLFLVDGPAIFNGQIKIANGTQGDGKVLTSDANGVASWQTPSATPASLSTKSWQYSLDDLFSSYVNNVLPITIAHGFSTTPIFFKASMIRVANPNSIYAIGDEIDLESCYKRVNVSIACPVLLVANSTSIKIWGGSYNFVPTYPYGKGYTQDSISDWRLKITAIGR